MPKGYSTLSEDQKQEIIKRIKEKGERVAELAQEYGVNLKTIYNLFGSIAGISQIKAGKRGSVKNNRTANGSGEIGKKMLYSDGR